MVTGVETAGLILGAIPLILASLEFYAKGIAVTRRCLKYKQQFHDLLVEIRTENAICNNSLNLLLVGIVKPKDMADFLANPRGNRWKDKNFDEKLKLRLGTTYDAYMATIDELNKTTDSFKQRLKLDAAGRVRETPHF